MSNEAGHDKLRRNYKKFDGNGSGASTWRSIDKAMNVGVILLHLLCFFAPFTFTWSAFRVFLGLLFVSGFGITLSYHRNLAHRSFTLPKWLEYFFAYWGVIALQRDPIYWVSIHRYHHQYVDSERDPHSPKEGFWFSHMGWLFNHTHIIEKVGRQSKNVEDLKKQPYYRFIRRTYMKHVLAHAFLLYAIGGFPYLVWAMGVRTVLSYHFTFLVNSACHVWGKQVWNTNDRSKNNWWVAVVTLGEGWHNNHHAFEFSARQGLEWWQYDVTWYFILFLQALGLATNVKLPTAAHKISKSFSAVSSSSSFNED